MIINTNTNIRTTCFHCGEICNEPIVAEEKKFCCEGCKQVYLLLNENNLCNYYKLDSNPGIKAKGKFVSERFAYLDDEATKNNLAHFNSETQTNITFHLPQMHCSSCVFLLENLHRIEKGVIKSQTNFQRKEIFIIFNPQLIALRKVVELLAFIGYEPEIRSKDTINKKTITFDKKRIYKIGIAGFCFANIMMLSFPEYFSAGHIEQRGLKETFTWLILFLSLPVLFFSASDFFVSAWKSMRQKVINIDAPIALAIVVTFTRSYYEIISGTGSGYLDSGTGIVFFMLIGRWFQNKTYDSFSFDKDYRSYFPLGATVISGNVEKNIPITQLKKGDRIILRNEEMVPADAILLSGDANIDYSFVSGENTPVPKSNGDMIFAGGKQSGCAIELQIIKDVSQSYITQLWNNDIFNIKKNTERSFIHPWSRYFTLVLFSIATIATLFWFFTDSSKVLPVLTSVLIVACPCSLLLSATFTYGNMLRIFGKNKLYLKNASVIESMAKIKSIVFDKTGTITQNKATSIEYEGTPLSERELYAIKIMAKQSSHPLSKNIAASFETIPDRKPVITYFKEFTGRGVKAIINDVDVKIGSFAFINEHKQHIESLDTGTHVHVAINDVHMGRYTISNQYRAGLQPLIKQLNVYYKMYVLSGDNDTEKNNLTKIFGKDVDIRFHQSPEQKLQYIQQLQKNGSGVLMLGDGLNDAGALMQSDVGIAVSDNSAQFSPACDAILNGENVQMLDKFLAYARSGKNIVTASFVLSILYNIVGLSFAVQAQLSPMVAAILMPASSISIVLLVTLLSSFIARQKGLK
ncbi:heavy metal translocating P-type ATPase [Ferruginibacter sp. SUN002]|uniref:heavy metal translocating P-type ATPase n=1 Tax=Ferruginibacter sp. SUN002 TaxID=2937789 RepID=UPI003D3682EA